ncbi:hypothetical protein [Paenibacillus azoreducens]|uniref:Uncharacterized protein n=1 Tax=Paenibacillus azoreducens TaxID=116718 RepID=A0A919YIF5_9BACL|nr:hypothetical protein [Paenibacillus azoreducens]GIO49938.1 hypothetical protein J34TS1_47030 [Paenibacillus azoreducens]
MFEAENARLAELKENMRNKTKWEKRLQELQRELKEHEREADGWKMRLADEEKDVERLMGASLTGLFFSLIGKKEEKLEREQLEVLEVKAKYDAAARAVGDIKQQCKELEDLLRDVRYSDIEFERILQEKEKWMLQQNGELAELAEQQADLSIYLKEMKEAVQAGRSVLHDLEQARDYLQSARNWGTYDMLGGGMISTHIKHNKIDEAMDYIHAAQTSLRRFGKELQDVQMNLSIEMDIDGFLRFSDYFFDGFIFDWMVQGRINDALAQVENKLHEAKQLVRHLESEYKGMETRLNDMKRRYESIIESAD